MNARTRIFAPLFAVALVTGAAAWIASAHADTASRAGSEAYEYDYLPSQLVQPAAYGEHVETL